jgi:hypothetical protein
MGMHPSNIAGGVAAVNSTMAMAATTRLGGLANHNRHLNYPTTSHPHNQQVLSQLGTGMVAYGVTGSNLSSTSSSSGVGTITNNSSSNGSSSGATGTVSTQAPAGNNNSYNHQSLPRHFLRGGVPAPTSGKEEETNGLPSSGIVMGPSHHQHPLNKKGIGVAGQLDHQHTHHTHQFGNTNGMQPLTHNGYPSTTAKKSINAISTVSNGLYDNSSPPISAIPNSRYLNQQLQNGNFPPRTNQSQQQKNRVLSSYYSTLRSQPAPPPPLPSQNSSLYHQAVPANVISNGNDSLSAIQPPKQFDSYYYHPATVGRGSPALISGGNDRQRPNSSGAVIDESDEASNIGMPSSRSSSKLGGSRVPYTDLSSQTDSSHITSHNPPRSSSSMSSHGINQPEYSVLKFNTNNIGTEIDV